MYHSNKRAANRQRTFAQGYLLLVGFVALLAVSVYPHMQSNNQVADVGSATICSEARTYCEGFQAFGDDVYNQCVVEQGCGEVPSTCTPETCTDLLDQTSGAIDNSTSKTPGAVDDNISKTPTTKTVGGTDKNVAVIRLDNPLKAKSIEELILAVVKTLLKLAIPVAIVFIIWSGFKFVMAQGKPEEIKKAIQTFQWTVIGLIVILGSYVIAKIITGVIKSLGIDA